MNWLQKISQGVGDVHDTLLNRPDIDDLRGAMGEIPGITCPDINKIIAALNDISKMCNRSQHYENAESLANDIEFELYDLEDKLEGLRTCNQ